MLVLPLAILVLLVARGGGQDAWWWLPGFVLFAVVVMGYSQLQVRRGQWTHVDASGLHERKSLNRFLGAALLVCTLLSGLAQAPRELTLGLGLSTLMVWVAMLSAPWCKLSLHLAFVVFAAALLASVSWWFALCGLFFSGLVAWSRLHLQRHVPRDLIAGALTGAVAGLVFLLAHRYWMA